MATFDEIKNAIQAIADASNDSIRLGLGNPAGAKINFAGQQQTPGQEWDADKFTRTIIEGVANWFDDQELNLLKPKLNDLIAEFNQLLDDYNNGVVPSTATSVTPLYCS